MSESDAWKHGYEEGYDEGYEDGKRAVEDDRREKVELLEEKVDSLEEAVEDLLGKLADAEDTIKTYEEEADADDKYTVTMSAGLFTASVTANPAVFETSVLSAHDALGRLIARLGGVRTLGALRLGS